LPGDDRPVGGGDAEVFGQVGLYDQGPYAAIVSNTLAAAKSDVCDTASAHDAVFERAGRRESGTPAQPACQPRLAFRLGSDEQPAPGQET
jgi:hypothetical protein